MKRLALILLFAAPIVAQTTIEKCQTGHCYGYGAPTGASQLGFIYQDVSQTPPALYCPQNSAWVSCGGSGGGLSSFTTGNLSPLFNVSLGATPTTAPAQSFTLSNAGQNLFFAGPTGGTGAPSYRAITVNDIPSLPTSKIVAAAITGATADYNFLQGSGTTLTDITGNGNNGTLGSGGAAPVWLANGLSFTANTQSVILPASLNTAKTWLFSVYINGVSQNGGYASNFGLFLTSSLGPSGLNLLYYGNGPLYMSPQSFSGGSNLTNCTTPISGFHVIGFALGVSGTSTDHFYIDGTECTNYSAQGASFGFQTSGNLFLGGGGVGPFASAGFVGSMYRVVAIPSALTASQIQVATQQLIGDAASRGVPITPLSRSQGKPTFFAVGDSITFGFGVSSPWESNMSLNFQPNLNVLNYGISGKDLSQIASSDSNRVGPMCGGGNGPQVATVFAGTNDVAVFGDTVANTVTYMALEIQQLRAAGCRVFVGTMLSRNGFDTQKDSYDTALLQQSKTMGADGFIDFASDPLLGADGASTNATWFQGDDTHPTQTGQNRMGVIASNSLNYYFGSTAASPNTTTAATYQMLSGDGYLEANPSANGQVITLPDCMGPTGATYTVTNISAFTSSVKGGTFNGLAETINFTTIGTAVSLPINTSIVFRDVRNASMSASGCHWEK